MVKRQKEKQYQSARENRTNQQLRSNNNGHGSADTASIPSSILPFSHCALSLIPFETPVCNSLGIIFDRNALMQFVLRYKMDPVTGAPIANFSKDGNYISLNMDQNEEGTWQCPILTKPFNDRSKVIAVIQSCSGGEGHDAATSLKEANVYSYEAYLELNIKPKNYEDFMSGQKFHPKNDVIIIYDPADKEFNRRRNINSFYHILHSKKLNDGIDSNKDNNDISSNVRYSVTATRVMETLRKKQIKEQEEEQARQQNDDKKRKIDSVIGQRTNMGNTIYYSSQSGQPLTVLASDVTGVEHTVGRGGMSSSLTSTATSVSDTNLIRNATDEEIITAQCNVMRYQFKHKKGYVKLHTNFGPVTIELHCDIAPRTCMNFLGLCRHRKYDETIFHRLIPKFMIQGGGYASDGRKANDDREESSIWGSPFDDEYDHRLQHNAIGIVSMANSGPNTNQQQFFITFQSCSHLDKKHSIFGVVVDGLDVVKEWERVPVTKKDFPTTDIKIMSTEVLVDPAHEAYEYEQKRIEKSIRMREKSNPSLTPTEAMIPPPVKKSSVPPQVGQYLPQLQKVSVESTKPKPSHMDATVSSVVTDRRHDPATKLSTAANTVRSNSQSAKPSNNFGNFSGW